MRRFFLFVLLFVSCIRPTLAADLWSTAVAERPRDHWKFIHRFIVKLENPAEALAYPISVTLWWKYEGQNGLPTKAELNSVYRLEDFLEEHVEKRGEGKLAIVSTGNNLRTWNYYVKSDALFRKALLDATAAVELTLQVSAKPDPSWAQLEDFKKGVTRP